MTPRKKNRQDDWAEKRAENLRKNLLRRKQQKKQKQKEEKEEKDTKPFDRISEEDADANTNQRKD